MEKKETVKFNKIIIIIIYTLLNIKTKIYIYAY